MAKAKRAAARPKLDAADLEMFSKLRIPADIVEAAGIERVSDVRARDEFGITGAGDMSGIVFPYFIPGGNGRVTCRLRRDHPEVEDSKPKNKYIAPYGDCRHLYFPPGARELLEDSSTEIVFVESEKGALAMLAWSKRVGRRLLSVGTGGCYGWRGRIGKAVDAGGERVDEVGALPDLCCADNRKVYVLFDSNASTNPNVHSARLAFAAELRKRKAEVAVINLPAGNWNGPDDYVTAHDDADMEKLFEEAQPQVKVGSTREDTSNADRFAAQHGESVRYWHGRNKWLLWTGTHWVDDEEAAVRELAKSTARSIYGEAAVLPEDEAKRMGNWAERSLSRQRIDAMLDLAKSIPGIAITTDILDSDPYALNCLNGTVDLRTGKLHQHQRENYITKLVRWPYTPDLVSPTWCWFVEQTFGPELYVFVQKAVGHSLTGITLEKVVFFLLGPTNTGKTTFLSTLRKVFPDYSAALMIETLMWSKTPDNNTAADLADLRGARFVVTSETEEGQRLRESKLKRICQGQGDIRSARKYENPVTFPETHKLWIDANHAPVVKGTDDSIWKRLTPIPCTHRIPDAEINRELPALLLAEAEGIVSWCVAGAVRWWKEGLGTHDKIERTRASWRANMDLVGQFEAERCVKNDGDGEASQIYHGYREWCEQNGHVPISSTAFGLRLFERGYGKGKHPVSRRITYIGLKLRDAFEPIKEEP